MIVYVRFEIYEDYVDRIVKALNLDYNEVKDEYGFTAKGINLTIDATDAGYVIGEYLSNDYEEGIKVETAIEQLEEDERSREILLDMLYNEAKK